MLDRSGICRRWRYTNARAATGRYGRGNSCICLDAVGARTQRRASRCASVRTIVSTGTRQERDRQRRDRRWRASFAFRPEETVAEAATRVGREQLDKAIAELTTRRDHDPDTAIHNARKAIKRERSLLRLVGPSLPRGERRHERAALRDGAHRLSAAGDAAALIATTDALSQRYAGHLPKRAFGAIRAELAAEHGGHSESEFEARVAAATAALETVRERTPEWEIGAAGWPALDTGLRRSYTRGRRALARAQRGRSDEALHDWRKRVKDLSFHSQLLAGVCGPVVAGQAKDAHALADLLGDDHDLAVLDEALARGLPAPVDVDAVRELIAHRRDERSKEDDLPRLVLGRGVREFIRV